MYTVEKFVSMSYAGRPCLIGNIFIIAITFSVHQLELIKLLQLRGCEKFDEKTIEDKANKIIDTFDFWIEEITTREMNSININELMAKNYMISLSHVNSKIDAIYAENFDYSESDFKSRLSKFPKCSLDYSLWMIDRDMHKKYVISQAAYVLAKFYHNCHMNDLREEWGNIGSGYLGNKKTEEFVISNLAMGEKESASIVRYKSQEVQSLGNLVDY